MANEVRITRNISANSTLVRGLIQQGAEKLQRELRSVEAEVVQDTKRLIAQDFVARTGKRHKEGTPHLGSNIRVKVISPSGGFPITLEAVLLGEDQGKIGALEYGAKPHPITAHGNGFLYFPSDRTSQGKAFGIGALRAGKGQRGFIGHNDESILNTSGKGKGSRGGSSKNLVKRKSVDHPGNRPHHFMKKALDNAVHRALARGR